MADARNSSATEFDRIVKGLTDNTPSSTQIREVIKAFGKYVSAIDKTLDAMRQDHGPIASTLWGAIWSVTCNREATTALTASQRTIKADAACAVFSIRTDDITWAVVDGGIDARHPAFRDRTATNRSEDDPFATTRVRATYDFALLRDRPCGCVPPLSAWIDPRES